MDVDLLTDEDYPLTPVKASFGIRLPKNIPTIIVKIIQSVQT